ncbi:MAG: helix-turn-helix transcriptional regulator [Pseudomonadota bacterium]
MTLDHYLSQAGMTAADFGALIQVSEASVSRIRKGEQNLSRNLMRRIIEASGGKVTADGLLHVAGITAAQHVASPDVQSENIGAAA